MSLPVVTKRDIKISIFGILKQTRFVDDVVLNTKLKAVLNFDNILQKY